VVSRWVYALVAAFPVMDREVSLEALRGIWQGSGRGGPLLVEAGTLAIFSTLWGPPAEGAVRVLPAEELLDTAWEHQGSWALVPFEALEPRWTVLAVDGLSPLQKNFQPEAYPLSVPVGFQGEAGLVQRAVESLGPAAPEPLLPANNRDGSKLTVLAMTGVTALVRATAHTMERQGVDYPGQDIRSWLADADLTHISNEVPFARDCPAPDPLQADMRFCSDPRYIRLLETVGTDIVELTGDHFQDWGAEAMLFTLDLYEERGWLTYGGGENLAKARQAVTVEHNGNRLAFIGCNAKGGGYAQAGEDRPGAAACDMDWMRKEMARLRAAGYLPVATFQHFEYYTYNSQPDQRRDFRALAEAGAVIVSGSQAHQPQAIEFSPGAGGTGFIHYGLGNLFFDQYDVSLACRQGFIDRHVFYNGRYLGVELLPILFVDYARARPMQADERQELLRSVFGASGW
jgi:poly-gamma-glutamate synthesis protein (capsule biosynthesis protein)